MVRLAVVLDVPGWSSEDIEKARQDMVGAGDLNLLDEIYIPEIGAEVPVRWESVDVLEDVVVTMPDAPKEEGSDD